MKRTLLIVTGASHGLGRAICVAFASSSSIPSLRALLVARSEDGLTETASLMRDAAEQSSTDPEVSYIAADLSDLDTLEQTVKDIFTSISSSSRESNVRYDRAILINNAGSLGYLGRCRNMPSLAELQHAINFNITSSIWLSSQFVRTFAPEGQKESYVIIVNISSLCAVEPFSTMAVYCAGKAARDMFHSVIAKEEKNIEGISPSPSEQIQYVKVLNYAPGMCETKMSLELAECDRLDTELSSMYQISWKEKTMIQPKDTAEKLVRIVIADKYKSGAHIDYWDELDE